ncbi:MAG: PC4/YdbC family ssDNA-binding protein [Peptococcaceae bacterium]|nr:PC4/YdbC family ssDNA-binding protein [Peptococcaceae bacterium]
MSEPTYKVIPRSNRSEVRIQKSTFKDRDFLDVRVYKAVRDKETGEDSWIPTKKGLSIPWDELPTYIQALQEAAAEAASEAQAEADAAVEIESRPPAKLCADCQEDCKQWTDVVSCPRYKRSGGGSGPAPRKRRTSGAGAT